MTDQWQPIETAPKDGTAVDLWTSYGERVPNAEYKVLRNRVTACWAYSLGYGENGYELWDEVFPAPTHWRPVPDPPSDVAGEQMNCELRNLEQAVAACENFFRTAASSLFLGLTSLPDVEAWREAEKAIEAVRRSASSSRHRADN